MKTPLLFILCLCFYPAYGQITYRHNAIRAGDEIVKQQVEYKDPGRAGENVIWDFSKLEAVNPAYTLSYASPPSRRDSTVRMGYDTFHLKDNMELITGREHHTQYFYHISNGVLYNLGYENAVNIFKHNGGIPEIKYPFNYRDSAGGNFTSSGIYSSVIPVSSSGNTSIVSDAYGKMVLPSKDTLSHVLRLKTIKYIREDRNPENDSIIPVNIYIESYKWYSKGYRYPVFETIKSISADTVEHIFKTSFFYPPQNHYYLDTDAANLAVLDSIWNAAQKTGGGFDPGNTDGGGDMMQAGTFSYNFYPNPVETRLSVEYLLEKDAVIGISVYYKGGMPALNLPLVSRKQGLYYQDIDFSKLPKGSYILRITVGDETVNNIIIKK